MGAETTIAIESQVRDQIRKPRLSLINPVAGCELGRSFNCRHNGRMTGSDPAKTLRPTPTRQAWDAWGQYCEKSEIVVHVSHETFRLVQMAVAPYDVADDENGRTPKVEPQVLEHFRRVASFAKDEADTGYAFVHAQSLLGLWGALECFVEDLFIGLLEEDPALLGRSDFDRIRLPVRSVAASDARETYAAVLAECSRSTSADLGQGVSRFERLLVMVGLGGSTPRRIKDAVYESQQIRNVWAHRAGIADERFVVACPWLGLSVGDRVDMSPDHYLRLMHGLHMFGIVLWGRLRERAGAPTIRLECSGYEGVLEFGEEDYDPTDS